MESTGYESCSTSKSVIQCVMVGEFKFIESDQFLLKNFSIAIFCSTTLSDDRSEAVLQQSLERMVNVVLTTCSHSYRSFHGNYKVFSLRGICSSPLGPTMYEVIYLRFASCIRLLFYFEAFRNMNFSDTVY